MAMSERLWDNTIIDFREYYLYIVFVCSNFPPLFRPNSEPNENII